VRFFRFRSANNLLGDRKELENQGIYFAPRETLNDPMEGFRDLFWHGDEIIWRNLFRHYLLCLDRVYVQHLHSGKQDPGLWTRALPVREPLEDSPPEYRTRFARVEPRFFDMQPVIGLLTGLAGSDRKVRQHELRFYLQYLHYSALEACLAIATEDGLNAGHDQPSLAVPRDFFTGTDFLPRSRACPRRLLEYPTASSCSSSSTRRCRHRASSSIATTRSSIRAIATRICWC